MGAQDPCNRRKCVGNPHEEPRVTWGNVQVVHAKSCPAKAAQPYSEGETHNCAPRIARDERGSHDEGRLRQKVATGEELPDLCGAKSTGPEPISEDPRALEDDCHDEVWESGNGT